MHRRPSLITFTVAAVISGAVWAEDAEIPLQPTFFADVLPVLQDHCQSCHRPVGENLGGMIAPISFSSYDEVRPWAKSIARKVQAKEMPPWFASDHTRGVFHGERRLSQRETEILTRWSRTGARRGDPAEAPPRRVFAEDGTGGWTNGKPDLVISLPQPFLVKDDVEDLNISFQTTISDRQLPEDTWVQGVEFKVGGTYVHHMCASLHVPGETAIGKFSRNSLGCIALGAEPTLLPDGYAYLLPKGSTVRFSMHYHKEPGEGTAAWDQSQMGFVFAKGPVRHRVRYSALPNLSFQIPPGAPFWPVGAVQTFDEETTLLALWPHAHLRAVAARYTAYYPDGSKEMLLDVPRYDQEWQTTYRYIEPKRVPAGTRLEAIIWYNNTPERALERGFDANRAVSFGPRTTDEMMLGFFNYTHTEPIDFVAHPELVDEVARLRVTGLGH